MIFSDNSENPEILEISSKQLEISPTTVYRVSKDLLRASPNLIFILQLCVSADQITQNIVKYITYNLSGNFI